VGANGLGDPYYPQLGNGGYDALHYTLRLAVDPESNSLAGTATITAQATQVLGAFNLDFAGLTIEQITVNGQKTPYRRDERELTVTPAIPLQNGEQFTVAIAYAGSPSAGGVVAGLGQQGWLHNPTNEIIVSSEPAGAATWYPVNDHPLDKASYTFLITVPKPYVVAANGLLQAEVDNGETVTYHWTAAEPMASYLATINIGEYVLETVDGPDDIVIRNYLPPDFPDRSKAGIAQTAEMLAFFSALFGPYPFAVYGSIVVDMPASLVAMETQTLSQHDNSSFALSATVVVHELAHQWFGNSVSLETWQDIWLKEGAATYAEWLWVEEQDGTEALNRTVSVVYRSEALWAKPVGRPAPADLYSATVYDRGALTFHALRLHVGDELFFEILRTYTDQFHYGNASTADFIAVAEAVSGEELDDFFDGWLYTDELPPIPALGLEP
jgi:aminopeptidase N